MEIARKNSWRREIEDNIDSKKKTKIKRSILLLMVLSVALVTTIYDENKADSVTQPLDIGILGGGGDYLTLTPPPDYDWGNLDTGINQSSSQTVTVNTDNSTYGMKIKCNNTESYVTGSSGNMNEYDINSSTYVSGGKIIVDELEWKGGDQAIFIDITSIDTSVLTNATSTQIYTDIYYQQYVDYGDQKLPSGKNYQIINTFTADSTW